MSGGARDALGARSELDATDSLEDRRDMSALAPSLVLDAIREMSAQERHELRELLALSIPDGNAGATLLTVQEAAHHAACHVETLRRAIRSGALHASQVGSTWRVAPADLKTWMEAPTRPREPSVSERSRRQRGRSATNSLDAAFATARARTSTANA